ncbi:MAG: IS1595 family transposase [Gemmatimonadota bacterium]|nr:IS1595 family transposase [Gemmatimonadota bacterium]
MLKQRRDPETLADAIRFFADPDASLAFMVQLRWASGVVCPRCNTDTPSYLRSRRIWKCRGCRKQFSVKVGTIFEDSPLGLDKWLPALWLIANAKNGISSYELGRALGVTQKTGWFMLHRIRLAMQSKSFEQISGDVEIDEAFFGGKAKYMHRAKRKRVIKRHGQWDKAKVLGMLERKRGSKHSIVTTRVVQGVKRPDLFPLIQATVEQGSNVYTDAFRSYRTLSEMYNHAAVDHAICYAKGQVHTNGLENFWSLMKRTIKGTYVSVDPFHLFRYLDEQVFRFNNRETNDRERFVRVLASILGKRLTYAELISADMLPATT